MLALFRELGASISLDFNQKSWGGGNGVVSQLHSQVAKLVGKFACDRTCPSTRWKLSIHLLLILFLALCLVLDAPAQTTTSGGLTGIVSDPSHAVVPAAVVELRDDAKGTIQTAKTDADGVYRFFFLAPGRYKKAKVCLDINRPSHGRT
jgi:hypothetical protein